MKKILEIAIEQMAAALTILDPEGNIVYFNQYSTTILDRKPEYIGRDIKEFHIPKSNLKISQILKEYAEGSEDVHTWQLEREGVVFQVRVAPIYDNREYVGLSHVVMPLDR
jgi:PAS domain S-box-containing protein